MKKSISLIISVFVMLIISMIGFNAFADEASPIVLDKNNTDVVLGYTSITYAGKQRTPNATLTFTDPDTKEEIVLKKNKDYTVTYENNVNAGTATVIIEGVGSYSGNLTESFTITPIAIKNSSAFEVSLSYTQTVFSGSTKTPIPTVYWIHNNEKTLLKKNTDYQVKYSNNTNVGKAAVTITGINDFTSSITKDFIINPKAVTGFKTTGSTDTTVSLKWDKQSYITGYEIFLYNTSQSKYVKVATVPAKNNSYTVKTLTSGYVKLFKIRAYKNINDKEVCYGKFDTIVKTATNPARVVLKEVGKSGSNKIKVSWNKVKCSNYQIFYSTDKSFKKNVKSVIVKNNKATSYTINNVNNKRTYYVKVRGILNYNNKSYKGTCSQYLSTYYANLYATYYSYYENNPNRTNNLRLASKAITGTIVQPGETFSFNKVVGPRTTAKGYKEAHVFAGENVVNGVGGGICQVASTMFNCALLSNVSIVERHQHSQRVAYVPLGRDAAIYGNAEDFKWKNNTKYPIKIVMTVKDGIIRCSFYTCENAKPSKVSINVTQSGRNFYMKRSVNGKVNYSCKSNY